jgi:uncharacterized protein YqhQ
MKGQNITMSKKPSATKRAFDEDGALKTHVGGQALIEGIMMRGRYNWAVAVREPDGNIYTEEHDLASGKKKNAWTYWPIIRGCRSFFESLVLGYKATEISAMHAYGEEPDVEASHAESTDAGVSDGGVSGAEAPDAVVSVTSAAKAPGTTAGVVDDAKASETGHAAGKANDPTCGIDVIVADASTDATVNPNDPEGPAPGDFSWKDDFGRPDPVIDALGAQRRLEVVCEPEHPHESEYSREPERRQEPERRGASDPRREAEQRRDSEHRSEPSATSDDEGAFGHTEMMISMVIGIILGVVLFIVAPAGLANLIVGEYDSNTLAWNLVDGFARVGVFVLYIWAIGRMEDINRMFCYHGAEHKTIHCYEHGLPLTPENARSFPRLHVRCGTAFLIMVMILAILIYTITPINGLIEAWGVPDGAPKFLLVITVRIIMMPLIAGIAYEITVKWAGSHPENPLVRVVLWPGLQMQRLTTHEPDDGMLECAIAAMKLVLAREEAEAAKGEGPQAKKPSHTAETIAAAATLR